MQRTLRKKRVERDAVFDAVFDAVHDSYISRDSFQRESDFVDMCVLRSHTQRLVRSIPSSKRHAPRHSLEIQRNFRRRAGVPRVPVGPRLLARRVSAPTPDRFSGNPVVSSPIRTLDRSYDSHVSCVILEHSPSSKARTLVTPTLKRQRNSQRNCELKTLAPRPECTYIMCIGSPGLRRCDHFFET